MNEKIIKATHEGNLAEIKHCLSNGASVDTRDKNTDTLLIIAAAKGYLEIVKYLVKSGADIDASGANFTPLTVAFECNQQKIVEFLVVQKAIKKRYIEGKENEGIDIIINKLITTLLYESKRHGWDSIQCEEIRDYIKKIGGFGFHNFKKEHYIDYINRQETENNTFYGSYLSDDSDSEEEMEFKEKSPETKEAKSKEAEKYMNWGQITKLTATNKSAYYNKGDLKNIEKGSEFFDLSLRSKIHYDEKIAPKKTEQDLTHLNFLLKENFSIQEATHLVETKFYVAQFRGITYLTTKWNQPSRQKHRADPEINEAQYSASIYKAMNIDLFRFYSEAKELLNKNKEKINDLTNLLHEILLTFREPRPYSYDGYAYANLAYLVQSIYTGDYDLFHRLIKEDPLLKNLLINDVSPFVSMGDTPYHPLKYAYGIKPYKGHEDERLRPRWQSNGRAERPYSGSVYVSLHPLTDFELDTGPLHLISLNRLAEIKLKDELVTIAERETCFPSSLPEQRVIYKHVAKYPSFKENYKKIYFYKYGLTKNLYTKFKQKLQTAKPHTDEMKAFKKTLGEWLCSYYEVNLIDVARKAAEQKGGVLIYQDINGQFSLQPPVDSVNRNTSAITKEIKTPIKDKQKRRASFSPGKTSKIQPVENKKSISEIINSMNSLTIADTNHSPLILDSNHSTMNTPLSLLVNSIENDRFLALEFFLRKEFFQKVLNEKFNYTDFKNVTLLHFAVILKKPKAVEILLNSKKINLEEKAFDMDSRKNKTALQIACDLQEIGIINTLIKAGSEKNFSHPLLAFSSASTFLSNDIVLPRQFVKLGLKNDLCNMILPCGESYYYLYQQRKFVEYFYHIAAHGGLLDAKKKMICYELAENEGVMPAYDVGLMYFNGEDFAQEKVEQNFEKAIKYFKLAAAKGIGEALTNLGVCYLHGDGVDSNFTNAVYYFQLALQKNIPEAQANLAYCYEHGYGIEKNREKAKEYYQQAANQNLAPAKERLEKLTKEKPKLKSQIQPTTANTQFFSFSTKSISHIDKDNFHNRLSTKKNTSTSDKLSTSKNEKTIEENKQDKHAKATFSDYTKLQTRLPLKQEKLTTEKTSTMVSPLQFSPFSQRSDDAIDIKPEQTAYPKSSQKNEHLPANFFTTTTYQPHNLPKQYKQKGGVFTTEKIGTKKEKNSSSSQEENKNTFSPRLGNDSESSSD